MCLVADHWEEFAPLVNYTFFNISIAATVTAELVDIQNPIRKYVCHSLLTIQV